MTEDEIKALYRERAHLVALLAAQYPATIGYTDPETPEWAVVTVILPAGGQVTWHISPDDVDLFDHVEQRDIPWDGHDTAEKYARVRAETVSIVQWKDVTRDGR